MKIHLAIGETLGKGNVIVPLFDISFDIVDVIACTLTKTCKTVIDIIAIDLESLDSQIELNGVVLEVIVEIIHARNQLTVGLAFAIDLLGTSIELDCHLGRIIAKRIEIVRLLDGGLR